jgi:hypothetical protein
MKLILTLLVLGVLNSSFAQTTFAKKSNYDTLDFKKLLSPHDLMLEAAQKFVYRTTESNGVLIQNSFPKGGPYRDPPEEQFGYRVFWTRIVNENDTPIELLVRFSADSIATPELYLKLFLPPDSMSLDKVMLYSYGVAAESFLKTGLHKSTQRQKTIEPKGEYLFYIIALATRMYGPARAELVLNDGKLFYSIKGISPDLDAVLIPCGHIILQK